MAAPPAGHRPHHVGGEDLSPLAGRTQAGRLNNGVPEVIVQAQSDLTPAQPDAQGNYVLTPAVVAFHALLHGHRAQQGRRCHAEHHHEAVGQALHLGAARLGDRLAEGSRSAGGAACRRRRVTEHVANSVEPTMSVTSTVMSSVTTMEPRPHAVMTGDRSGRSRDRPLVRKPDSATPFLPVWRGRCRD